MSCNHQGKLTIAPDFDWITGDHIGFEVLSSLLKLLHGWNEWKLWSIDVKQFFFGGGLFFFFQSWESAFLFLPVSHTPSLSSLFLSSNFLDRLTSDCKSFSGFNIGDCHGAVFCCREKERPSIPSTKLWQKRTWKTPLVNLKIPCPYNRLLGHFAQRFPQGNT